MSAAKPLPAIPTRCRLEVVARSETPQQNEPQLFKVRGYYTGNFIGRLLREDAWEMRTFEVVDPLRRMPRNLCPFPKCQLKADHDGDHILSDWRFLRPGTIVNVWPHSCVKFLPYPKGGPA